MRSRGCPSHPQGGGIYEEGGIEQDRPSKKQRSPSLPQLSHHGGMGCYATIYRKADLCKFLDGCKKAIRSGEFCGDHQPTKPIVEKSDNCRSCGRELGVEVRVVLGVCYACYQKPAAKEARKRRWRRRKMLEEHAPHRVAGCKGMDYGSWQVR